MKTNLFNFSHRTKDLTSAHQPQVLDGGRTIVDTTVRGGTHLSLFLLILLTFTFGFGQSAWAYTATFYCVPKAMWGDNWSSSKTVRLNCNSDNGWKTQNMSGTGHYYQGNEIYSTTVTTFSYDGARDIQFQRYNGDSQEDTWKAYNDWNSCSYWSNHLFDGSWHDYAYDPVANYAYIKYVLNGEEKTYKFYGTGMNDPHPNVTISSDFTITAIYFNHKKNGGNVCGGNLGYKINNGSDQSYEPSSWSWQDGSDGTKEFYNSSCNFQVASSTQPSGNYTISMWWKMRGGYAGNTSDCSKSWYLSNGGGNYNWTYKVLPPDVSNFQIQATGTMGGDGSENNPYLIAYNTALTLTASGDQAHTDANSSLQVKFGSDSYSATNSKTISNIKNTTKQSIVVKAKYYNSTASLSSANESIITIYYIVPQTALTLDKNNSDVSGSADGAANVSLGTASFTASQPTRTGYENKGYYLESECTSYVSTAGGTLQANVSGYTDGDKKWIYTGATKTLYTKWSASKYNVTLDQTDATTAATRTSPEVTFDAALPTINAANVPSRDYYTFAGYWTNNGKTSGDWGSMLVSNAPAWQEVSGFTETVSSTLVWKKADNATVYPKWTPITYNITYTLNGGTNYDGAPSQYTVETPTITLGTPTKAGHKFSGWTLNGTTITEIPLGSHGDITLVANWTPKTYSITLDANYTPNKPANIVFTATYGQASPISATHSRTGYDFKCSDNDCLKKGYWMNSDPSVETAGTRLVNPTGNFTTNVEGWTDNDQKWIRDAEGSITLYAHWSPQIYSITYKDQGDKTFSGDWGSVVHPTSHTYDAATQLVDAPNKTGYTFGGWYTSSDCSTGLITTLGATDYTANITLYAKWNPTTTTITINRQEGSATKEIVATYDGNISVVSGLANTDSVRTGYKFNNMRVGTAANSAQVIISVGGDWAFQPNAGGGTYTNSANPPVWRYTSNELTLYTNWTANQYTITLNNNGGEGGASSHTATYDSKPSDIASLPTKTVATIAQLFDGYWTSSDGGTTFGTKIFGSDGKIVLGASDANNIYTDDSGNWKYANPITLYAKWEAPADVKVTFGVTDGTQAVDNRGSISAVVKGTSTAITSGVTDVPAGSVITITYAPAKGTFISGSNGWASEGWYSNRVIAGAQKYQNAGNSYDYTVPAINSEVFVNAPVVTNTFAVVVASGQEAMGGVSAAQGTAGPSVSQAIEATANTGYHFTTWSQTNDNFTFVNSSATDRQATVALKNVASQTITANFAANTYKVVFHINGGTGTDMQEQNFVYNEAPKTLISVSSLAISRDYYTFKEWSTNQDGTGTKYTDGQSVQNLTSENNAVVDLYAQWDDIVYDVRVMHQYYDCQSPNIKKIEDYSKTYTDYQNAIGAETPFNVTTSPAKDMDGFEHYIWKVYKNSTVICNKQTTSASDVSSTPTITGSDGSSSTLMLTGGYSTNNDKVYILDRRREIPRKIDVLVVNGTIQGDSADLERIGIYTAKTVVAIPNTGYHFTGWTKNENTNYTINLSDASSLSTDVRVASNQSAAASGSITANFVADVYNITYRDKGGDSWSGVWTGQHPEIHTYDQVTTLANPTRTGYNFIGWHKQSDCSDAVITQVDGKDYTANFTLYADWQPITYQVEFAGNGSTFGEMSNQDFVYDEKKTLTSNAYSRSYQVAFTNGGSIDPINASYTFNGWLGENSTSYSNGQSVSNLTSVDNDVFTMTAQWTGGSITLPTPTKVGSVFDGWYDGDTRVGGAGDSYVPGAAKELSARWTTVNVYLEGRARVKNAEGVETTINPNSEWVQTLKTIPFTFNSTDGVYYLNTYCTVLEQAANVGTGSNYVRMGIANGDGDVTPYGCNTAEDYKFTPDAKGSTVGATNGGTNNRSFKFRDVENYENDNFKRRYPVMYRYNPTTNMFDYCAPLLTLTYSGTTATMIGYTIALTNASAVADGIADDANKSITYEYKLGDGEWQTWSSDITAAAGTYKLRAIASGNNEFGQPVTGVISNEITVTVTTPAISAQVTHVNSKAGSIIRINDSFTIKHTVTGVPAKQSVKVCYHWSKKPAESAIAHDIFTPVQGDQTSVYTSIDVAGDYEIEISVSSLTCDQSGQPTYIKWQTYKLPIHVKGDEITVYAKLETSITDWNSKYVYYWRDASGTWPGYQMSYIGKDSLDYEWYSYNIANYKTFEGGKLLFNDGTTKYGLYQTTNVNMPVDDEFYYIKAAVSGDKRKVETYDHINVTRRVILSTDTLALYQFVTIEAAGQGVFFPTYEEMKYTYTVTDPDDDAVTLDAKNQFIPSMAGNYTLTIKCDAGTYTATNTFTLRVQANPLTLTPSATGDNIAIGTSTAVTVSSTGTLPSGNRTYTVIEPGTNAPITFQSNTASNTSSSYTLLSSGTYTFAVVLTDNSGHITGKAQCNVTVQPKKYYIKHPFKNTTSVADGDWVWKEMTYNAIDGTYQYKGDNAYFHKDKKANINQTGTDEGGKPEYTIVNPDNLDDNTHCVFTYDVTTDKVTVYALNKRLYRIKSICAGNEYFSNAITQNGQDISFFAQKDGQLIWQERATAADDWVDQAVTVTTTASASGIYTATPDVKATSFALTAYTGTISVFTQLINKAGTGAGTATAAEGKMTEFTKEKQSEYYNHYWVRYVEANTQAMATMGNSINNCIAITLPYYEMPADGNVRYAYDNTTNHFSRTFLAGSGNKDFLRIYGQHLDTLVSGTTYNPINSLEHSKMFYDGSDWIYTVEASGEVTTSQSVTGVLVTKFNGTNRWILSESGLEADPTSERVVLNQDVASPGRYNLTAIYDYKTNRLTVGGQPEPGHVFEDTVLIDQLILTREGDADASYFNVMEEARLVVVDKMTVELIVDKTNDFVNKWGGSDGAYTVMYYWFSLPYQCRINEIYGLGVYGEKFEVQRYRGDLRAAGTAGGGQQASAWRKLKATATMEANRGYVIAIRVKGSDFKEANKQHKIRLFFPSTEKVELSHGAKTILAENENNATSSLHWNWNIMGNPLIANGKGIIDKTSEPDEAELNFIYVWDWAGGQKIYTPESYNDVALKSTHGYMVQAKGAVYWSYPAIDSKTAPARYLEAAQFASEDSYGKLNIRLNISQDEQLLDKTYILYREDGDRDEYEMGRDLEKIINSGVTQMYASPNNNLAAICLNSEDKNMIPLTVIANSDGNYTFSLHRQLNSDLEPTIYDAQTQQYTNLSMSNCNVVLTKGTYTNRFFFLLRKTGVITNMGELKSNNYQDGVQKIILNEQLYILRDGQVYRATGSLVK